MSKLPHYLDNRLTDGGKVVNLTSWQPFTPGRILVLISVKGWVDPRALVLLEGLGKLKSPMISSGFETETLLLVA
jgi:hypothetical protein